MSVIDGPTGTRDLIHSKPPRGRSPPALVPNYVASRMANPSRRLPARPAAQHNFGRNISGSMLAITYFLVLRSVSRVGGSSEADAAPGAHRGRAAVRRLRRTHHGGDRRGDRRDPARRDLRRRTGGVEF